MALFAPSSAKNCRLPKPHAPTKKSWSQAPPEKSSSFLKRGDEIFARIVSLPPVCDGQQSAEFSTRFLGSGSVSDYHVNRPSDYSQTNSSPFVSLIEIQEHGVSATCGFTVIPNHLREIMLRQFQLTLIAAGIDIGGHHRWQIKSLF